MKKVLKCLAILVAVGAVIGIIITLLCKSNNEEEVLDSASEDEDFDLDSDLQAPEREYVPLKKAVSEESKKESEDPSI